MAIMHWNGEFSKIKGSICNILIEASNICNILPRPAASSELIGFKLKRDLKYMLHKYLEPVRPITVHQTLTYLKSHDKLYKYLSITKGLSNEDMFLFSDNFKIRGQSESVREKIFLTEKNH